MKKIHNMKLHTPSILLGAIIVSIVGLTSAFQLQSCCLTTEQKAVLALLSVQNINDCVNGPGYKTLRVTGANLQVVNGLGSTDTTNGLGNLIVGYNESPGTCNRVGSHNIIDGYNNDYTSYGSIIISNSSISNAEYAGIIGGYSNTNNAAQTFIGGGVYNIIESTAGLSAMIGGTNNTNRSYYGVIAGGSGNETAFVESASCFGGDHGYASGLRSTTLGGGNSTIFPCNQASGAHSTTVGGQQNIASGNASTALGGALNISSASNSVVSGGIYNVASGNQSSVSGGNTRTAPNTDDWVAGSLLEDN